MFGTLRKLITYRHSGVIELQCINKPTEFRTRKNLRYKICLENLTLQVRKLRSWELCGVCALGIQRGSSSDYKFTSLYIWSFEIIILKLSVSSFAQSYRTLCDPPGLQHARLPCPSPTPGAYSNSCPLSRWCQPTISSSHPLLLLPQSFLASGSFPMS